MKRQWKRVIPLALPTGGLAVVAFLLALHHATQVLASGPWTKYGSDRALKEQIAPVDTQQVLARLVKAP